MNLEQTSSMIRMPPMQISDILSDAASQHIHQWSEIMTIQRIGIGCKSTTMLRKSSPPSHLFAQHNADPVGKNKELVKENPKATYFQLYIGLQNKSKKYDVTEKQSKGQPPLGRGE